MYRQASYSYSACLPFTRAARDSKRNTQVNGHGASGTGRSTGHVHISNTAEEETTSTSTTSSSSSSSSSSFASALQQSLAATERSVSDRDGDGERESRRLNGDLNQQQETNGNSRDLAADHEHHGVDEGCSLGGEFDYRNGFGKTEAAERERRERISLANSGREPWNRGVPHRQETKARIRQALVETYANNPELVELVRVRQLGRKHSQETKQKIRKARLAHVESKAGQKERRKKVNTVWQSLLEIQDRREHLYYQRKKLTKQKKAQAKKQQQQLLVVKKGKANAKGGGGGRVKSGGMSDEHRKRISHAMKKKWQTKEFRDKVETGMATRSALEGRTSYNGNTKRLVHSAQVERMAMRKKQEKLKKRAAELLAMAHEAAEHLKTMNTNGGGSRQIEDIARDVREEEDEHKVEREWAAAARESAVNRDENGSGLHSNGMNQGEEEGSFSFAGGEGKQQQEQVNAANVEIQNALRSLDDAEALVAKLQKRSKMH